MTEVNSGFSTFRAIRAFQKTGGIGLDEAKTIADFHRIDIQVISEIEKGTTFSFIFPENS
jgi:signal transduction histidine kinase